MSDVVGLADRGALDQLREVACRDVDHEAVALCAVAQVWHWDQAQSQAR